VNGQVFGPGDGAAIEGERALTLAAREATEVLVFDLP
jgi:quercetinase-like protein